MSASVAVLLTVLASGLTVLVLWKRFRACRLPRDRLLERAAGIVLGAGRGVMRGSMPWLEVVSVLVAVCVFLVPDLVRIAHAQSGTAASATVAMVLAFALWLRAFSLWRVRRRPGAPVRESLLVAAVAAVYVMSASLPTVWSSAPRMPLVGFGAGLGLAALLLGGRVVDPLGHLLQVWRRKLEDPPCQDPRFAPSSALLARTEELRERFRRDRRLVIEDLLDDDLAEAVAESIRTLPLKRVRRGVASHGAPAATSVLTATFTPHQRCGESCKPMCALAHSFVAGHFRDFIRRIADCPSLIERSGAHLDDVITVQAWDAGSFVAPHADAVRGYDDPAIVFVWHASRRWQPDWGGVLRFTETTPPVELCPRFNTLHLWAISRANMHEVTEVTGPEVRYTLTGRLHDPLEGFAPRVRQARSHGQQGLLSATRLRTTSQPR